MRRALLVSACVLAVALVAVLVGGAVLAARFNGSIKRSDLLGLARATQGSDIHGPLNFLLVGSNFRTWAPANGERADTIMIVHVTADMKKAYLVSVPRDLYTTIKPYTATGYEGSTEKIDAALNFGGMPLLSQTVSDVTGVRFNGAIETRFSGFENAVQALGGITLCVDVETESVHIGHTADGKFAAPYTNTGGHPIPVPGVTPQVYHPGCQHMAAWQALDYVRQRELLPNGDYDRQRFEQQFIFAVLKQTLSAGTLANPIKLDQTLQAIASGMNIDTNGVAPLDYLLALRNISANSLVGLRAPSHPQTIGDTDYVVADPGLPALWQAIQNDTLGQWAAANPSMVNPLDGTTHPPAHNG
jgi:LCP family protein required for cell wall assembly